MERKEFDTLRIGDEIVVRFGSHGTQRACVVDIAPNGDKIGVRKWRANSESWTKRVLVRSAEVVGLTEEGAHARKIQAERRERIRQRIGC